MKRRTFLERSAAVVSGSLLIPRFLQSAEAEALLSPEGFNGKRLVIIQLSGGNDGLNTIVPFRNDLYYQNRSVIGLKKEQILTLDSEIGVNSNLTVLKELYDQGELAILNQVGYPNPNRSHFRSMDIWHTAGDADRYLNSGWLGRYLDNQCSGNGCKSHAVLEMDDSLSLALRGETNHGVALRNPEQFYAQAMKDYGFNMRGKTGNENLDYLYKIAAETRSTATYLNKQVEGYQSNVVYPSSGLSASLKQIARLIGSGADTRVYYTSIGGFDTHGNQNGIQTRRFGEVDGALKAFVKELKERKAFQDTLIMIFSEFGRRVKQNGSNGTDHGAANNLFLIGGKLKKKGFLNQAPDLSDLDDGDLKMKVDFRNVYATLLERWLEADSKTILLKKFPEMDFI